eukprot:TRINITY_DN41948_c0_g1_i1.p1 TRINITY_DN41948_c0_g1~~TRINITY_DN41948_c0_g1_i1.p1  ORF type:complete len:847 (+),score=139.60 TRINITY_DN41948_c0_g1_i1:24-2564(+)
MSIYEGYINKKGGAFGTSYQRRYFVLIGEELKYFKEKGAKEASGTIDLRDTVLETGNPAEFAFAIDGKRLKKKYELACTNKAELDTWLGHLKRVIEPETDIQKPKPGPHAATIPTPVAAPAAKAKTAGSPQGTRLKEEKKEIKPDCEVWVIKSQMADNSMHYLVENASKDMVTIKINLTAVSNVRVEAQGNTKYENGFATAVLEPGESAYLVALFVIDPKEKPILKVGYHYTKESPSGAYLDAHLQSNNAAITAEVAAVEAATPERRDMEVVAEACKKKGIKFVDISFPPSAFNLPQFIWQRPEQFLDPTDGTPTLFDDVIEPNDIFQGSLGDCWFMCALATMAEFPSVIRKCLPEKPNDTPTGCHRMRICKDGWWRMITVDDYLPCNVGRGPAYAKNKGAELWCALMEKAYAKLHGSYQAMKSGVTGHALAELTGFPYTKFRIKDTDPQKLWTDLQHWDKVDYMMSAGTPEEGSVSEEEYSTAGLATSHSYSVIDVAETHGHKLLKIRNPWGGMEWTGDWSDRSALWTDEIRKELNFEAAEDGLFWMSFDDFRRYFVNVVVCFCHSHTTWSDLRVAGQFHNGAPDFFLEVTIRKPTKAFVIVAQRDKRGQANPTEYVELGLIVLKPEGEKAYSVKEWVGHHVTREAWRELQLEAADRPYIIIPCSPTITTTEFKLGLMCEETAFGSVDIRAFEPDVLTKASMVATLTRGQEKVYSAENRCSAYVYSNGRWLGILGVNRGTEQDWNVFLDCRGSTGYYAPNSDDLVFETIVPAGGMRYIATLNGKEDRVTFTSKVKNNFMPRGDDTTEGFDIVFSDRYAPVEKDVQVNADKKERIDPQRLSHVDFC